MKQLKLKDALKEELTSTRRNVRATSYSIGLEEDGSLYIADGSDIVIRLVNKEQAQDFIKTFMNYSKQIT